MRQIILLLSFICFCAFTLSDVSAADFRWTQNDTVIKHKQAEFTTTFNIWLKNETNKQLTLMVRVEGDVSAFKPLSGYPIGSLFTLDAHDSAVFVVKFDSDAGQSSFLATFVATSTTDTARLVLASLFDPDPVASWEPEVLSFVAPNCQTAARNQAFLINGGFVDTQVDSVEIVGDANGSFFIERTSPPNRLGDFIIGPGGGSVTYELIFSPVTQNKEIQTAELIAYLGTGEQKVLPIMGIVSVADAEIPQTTISLGVQPMEHDIKYSSMIDNNTGSGHFVVSAVEIVGGMNVSLEGLDIDTVIEAQTTHSFMMTIRGTQIGVAQAQILIYGSPCDEPLAITIGAEFEEQSSVEVDPQKFVRITYADSYLRFDHEDVAELPYRVLDITGRTVLTGSAANGTSVNVSNLTSGTYFTILETMRGPVNHKFVKR